jgi:multidrug efflux system membrane fusion protein
MREITMFRDAKGARARPRKTALVALAVIAAAGGGALWLARSLSSAPGASRSEPAPIPVSVATVLRRDVPVYLEGLGTVQAASTVAIHSQVDGKLQQVLFTEGQHVRAGDVLAKIDPRSFQAALDQAKAKKAEDVAQLIAAQKDLERFTTLLAKNAETQQNVDLQKAKVDQDRATVDADQAAIESAQVQLDYTTIKAPTDGIVGVRQIDAGNIVHASDQTPIVTLTLIRPAAVLFSLPARELDTVRAAMRRGDVEVTAFDQDNRQALEKGKLLLVDNVIDQTTATIRLKALFPNEDERLWPGEFVNAHLLADTQNALTVPSTAVQRGPQGLFAWIVTKDGIAKTQAIETGVSSGDVTTVTSGLAEGDHVVTDGQYRLQPGARVVITGAPPSKSAT